MSVKVLKAQGNNGLPLAGFEPTLGLYGKFEFLAHSDEFKSQH
jgi:hypothetical protein